MSDLEKRAAKDLESMKKHLANRKWFHGNITRNIAELRLEKSKSKSSIPLVHLLPCV